MPVPVVTNVVEILVKGTVPDTGGQTKNFQNVFHYRLSVSGTPQAANAVGNAVLTNVWAPIAALLSIAYTGVSSLSRYLDDATAPYIAGNVPASGGASLPRLSSAEAIVTPLQTAVRGKSFRGSKHFGPLATAQVIGDEINPANLATWVAAVANLNAVVAVGGQTYIPVILSRSLSQIRFNPTSIVAADITTVLLNKTVG